ncbi:2,3-dihydroxyphenylpropionate 1,2-dioxygenase [Steroidobacter agaridevorans]|uniref:2,3-dihydroxyphenylpropionate 1,2-dioxygenase n=1 Tax=Steroidobacter agaridevorans TaxID=2695856 RepID=A0A829YN25_9GAMM|nr:protocatechuate 3,4-dioxygenase [Steroidobacter agaridevorans]GFE84650.1 2,3-dihydroxyphenylpropionate 1,2-dioxygenase [Steroidobacter agaridevorans]
MAEIVGGFIVPHDPLVFAAHSAAPEEQRRRVTAAFETVRGRIADLDATAAVIVGADHYLAFGPNCLPAYAIVTGELSGPIERLPGIPQGPIRVHRGLAKHIAQRGAEEMFDWSVAKSLNVDHSIGVPARVCLSEDMPVIAVLVAAGVEPLIRTSRAYALGEQIGRAVRSFDSDERVVVIGSGGISHWVGLPEMGQVNPQFDQMVLDCVARGDARTLIDLPDEYVLKNGGNGAFEIRTFLVAMGALNARKGEVIAYEPVREWITGLGFAALEPGATA